MITIENVQYKLENELTNVEKLNDGQLQTAIVNQSEKIEVITKQEKDLRLKVLDLRNALLKAELEHARKKSSLQHNKLIKTRLEAERDIRVMLDEVPVRKKRRRIGIKY